MTEPLKPCPFCGTSDALIVEHMEGTILHPTYRVLCDNCGASNGYTDRGDHIESWNRRAVPVETAAGVLLDALEAPPTDETLVQFMRSHKAMGPDEHVWRMFREGLRVLAGRE